MSRFLSIAKTLCKQPCVPVQFSAMAYSTSFPAFDGHKDELLSNEKRRKKSLEVRPLSYLPCLEAKQKPSDLASTVNFLVNQTVTINRKIKELENRLAQDLEDRQHAQQRENFRKSLRDLIRAFKRHIVTPQVILAGPVGGTKPVDLTLWGASEAATRTFLLSLPATDPRRGWLVYIPAERVDRFKDSLKKRYKEVNDVIKSIVPVKMQDVYTAAAVLNAEHHTVYHGARTVSNTELLDFVMETKLYHPTGDEDSKLIKLHAHLQDALLKRALSLIEEASE